MFRESSLGQLGREGGGQVVGGGGEQVGDVGEGANGPRDRGLSRGGGVGGHLAGSPASSALLYSIPRM